MKGAAERQEEKQKHKLKSKDPQGGERNPWKIKTE